jgi:hypothetical protein
MSGNEKINPAEFPLSVVAASTSSAQELDAFLSRVLPQAKDAGAEVIIVDSTEDRCLEEIRSRHPAATILTLSHGSSLPLLWGAGVARTRGRVIAVTETSCIPHHNWVQAILRAHESPYPVIGGAVEMDGARSLVDWAVYFCEYGQFMGPAAQGVVSEVPGNNVSFKSKMVNRGREFVENGFWKTYWCLQLQAEGVQLYSVPTIIVHYGKSYRLGPFIIRRFHHGRCFAGMRITRISPIRRLWYVVGSPFLPFLFLGRSIAAILPKKRHMGKFAVCLPIVVLAILSWSLGELCGYLAGPDTSCSHVI